MPPPRYSGLKADSIPGRSEALSAAPNVGHIDGHWTVLWTIPWRKRHINAFGFGFDLVSVFAVARTFSCRSSVVKVCFIRNSPLLFSVVSTQFLKLD
jgi:hypothetical protein